MMRLFCIQLYETLRRDCPHVHITAVQLDGIGVSIRFAPVESGQCKYINSSDGSFHDVII